MFSKISEMTQIIQVNENTLSEPMILLRERTLWIQKHGYFKFKDFFEYSAIHNQYHIDDKGLACFLGVIQISLQI